MSRKKSVPDELENINEVETEGEQIDPLHIAERLNDVVKLWKPTAIISGHALEFVKENVAALVEALTPTEDAEVEEVK